MNPLLSIGSTGASPSLPPAARATALATLARTADVPTLTIYARQHPQDRGALEMAMVKAGRTGDVGAMAQALKQKDFDVAIWTRYGATGGPTYSTRPPDDPAFKVADSPAWDGLERAGEVTASERAVIGHMSAAEGRLDSVQSYDNQIISAGAMQKTVNPQGTGELPRQVWDFREASPEKYQTLFADRGWTVERVGAGHGDGSFALRLTVDGRTLTPRETADYIKDRNNPEHWTTALDPFQKAGRDPDFQAQQIKDFQARLTQATGVVPAGYTHPIRDYVTSEQGGAMVLDHHVNRPAHVDDAFAAALDRFHADNPKADRDLTAWTPEQRARYEAVILDHYRSERASDAYKPPMTHATERADRLMGPASPLSADPGSFHRTVNR